MLSKIKFTYKRGNQNRKKEMILKELQTKERIKLNEKKSINNCLLLPDKVDNTFQNVSHICIQSSTEINNIQMDNLKGELRGGTDTSNIGKDYENNKEIVEMCKLYDGKKFSSQFLNIAGLIETHPVSNEYFLTDENFVVPYNVERIRAKGIKIINNVYQSKYNFGRANCTGLGDFIRGSYFILEFCDEYNFEPKIVFNNYIAKFLRTKTYKLNLIHNVLAGIQIFKNNNFSAYSIINNYIVDPKKDHKHIMADFVDYMSGSICHYGNAFVFCNSFPRHIISEKNKEYMRTMLEPIDEMKILIQHTLQEMQLSCKNYIVIHIRAGDGYLKNETDAFSDDYIHHLVRHIQFDIHRCRQDGSVNMNHMNHMNQHYLLMADNNRIKTLLQEYFPDFKMVLKPITHFGEGVILEEEKVKNTLLDFYLLSFAGAIFSYSHYEHGSGFSYWCAKTFDIPYQCKYIV
jgi:hypothetical protein